MSNQLSRSIIRQLSRKNSFGFTFLGVEREFPYVNPVYLARILSEGTITILFLLMWIRKPLPLMGIRWLKP